MPTRHAAALAALALALAAAGCGRSDPSPAAFRVALLSPGPISDDGWNAAAYEGLLRVERELGATVRQVEVKAPGEFEVAFRDFAAKGYDLVFGHGFEFSDSAAAAARDFPGTAFVVTSGTVVLPNASSVKYEIDQPALQAGVLAALLSASGRIGCVGGVEIPPVKSAFEAFARGARSVRPDAVVTTAWIGSWEDVASAQQAALALLDQGADLLFHNADAAGIGVFNACEQRGALAIGCNKDQARVKPKTVVASVVLDIPESFVRIARDVATGVHAGRVYDFDLASGIVFLAYNPELEDRVSDAVRQRVAAAIP